MLPSLGGAMVATTGMSASESIWAFTAVIFAARVVLVTSLAAIITPLALAESTTDTVKVTVHKDRRAAVEVMA